MRKVCPLLPAPLEVSSIYTTMAAHVDPSDNICGSIEIKSKIIAEDLRLVYIELGYPVPGISHANHCNLNHAAVTICHMQRPIYATGGFQNYDSI